MPVAMSSKKTEKIKHIKAQLLKEFQFLKNIFSVVSIPIQTKGDNEDNLDCEIYSGNSQNKDNKELPQRAQSIIELEEKLEKIKSQRNFNLKNKLAKKSLSSKLNKKIKKKERINKTKAKSTADNPIKLNKELPGKVNVAKPIFNNDGKLVFSKFDFANIGDSHREKVKKKEKDPKKMLQNLKEQEEKFHELEEKEEGIKVKELKEKMAWKNVLQKAEGHKIKDDPALLKKSIKKMEQKKKQSKKQWENRINNVEQKKEERQKKRKENIIKKKKEKKSKIVKAAVKRGRVVI